MIGGIKMSKNIQTAKANEELVKKFLDYANVADAAYALLEPVFEGNVKDKKGSILEKDIDTQTFGDKFNGENSTYAKAIEARFNKNKIVGKEGNWCFPFADICLTSKDITIDNDIAKMSFEDNYFLDKSLF